MTKVTGYHGSIQMPEECDLTVHPPGAVRWLNLDGNICWSPSFLLKMRTWAKWIAG